MCGLGTSCLSAWEASQLERMQTPSKALGAPLQNIPCHAPGEVCFSFSGTPAKGSRSSPIARRLSASLLPFAGPLYHRKTAATLRFIPQWVSILVGSCLRLVSHFHRSAVCVARPAVAMWLLQLFGSCSYTVCLLEYLPLLTFQVC